MEKTFTKSSREWLGRRLSFIEKKLVQCNNTSVNTTSSLLDLGLKKLFTIDSATQYQ